MPSPSRTLSQVQIGGLYYMIVVYPPALTKDSSVYFESSDKLHSIITATEDTAQKSLGTVISSPDQQHAHRHGNILPNQPPQPITPTPSNAFQSFPSYLNFTPAINVKILTLSENEASSRLQQQTAGRALTHHVPNTNALMIPEQERACASQLHDMYWKGIRYAAEGIQFQMESNVEGGEGGQGVGGAGSGGGGEESSMKGGDADAESMGGGGTLAAGGFSYSKVLQGAGGSGEVQRGEEGWSFDVMEEREMEEVDLERAQKIADELDKMRAEGMEEETKLKDMVFLEGVFYSLFAEDLASSGEEELGEDAEDVIAVETSLRAVRSAM
ncbi:hypothetical protein HDV00_004055 [Rhizophlyctis rosea]|nr:hypothetical protein HDV00_004055 [Rhizophlyctis rosea]